MKKTCYICGKEYIVSIKNTASPYICPTCDAQWKREQRKALEKKKKCPLMSANINELRNDLCEKSSLLLYHTEEVK